MLKSSLIKLRIEALEKDNTDLSEIQTKEAAIADLKVKIAAKEVVVKAREVAVAAAKAALDEVMPKKKNNGDAFTANH